MKKQIKAAQLGCGQLGKPWLHYVSGKHNWNVDLFKNTDDFKAHEYDCIFLAVRDIALDAIISKLKDTSAVLIHFSGSLYFKEAFGVHPVYSFPLKSLSEQKKRPAQKLKKETEAEVETKANVDFNSLNWVVDSRSLPDFVKELLGESIYTIDPSRKKAYHNYLSVSSNMSQLLSYLMGETFNQQTGLPPEILKSLLLQSIESEREYGVKSFSGPWVRGEKALQDVRVEEIKDHLLSLENNHFNKLIEVYNEHYKV